MRVAVVGTGSIGMRHVRLLQQVPGVAVVAVPVRPHRVDELIAQGISAVRTLEEALAQEPAGAIVATDTGRHAADAELCLRICPVLVEKPLAASTRDADRLVATARAVGRSVHVACCLRFDEGLTWAHERRAAIGTAALLDVECLSWLPTWRPARDHLATYSARPGEGGVLLDLIHDIDSCCWFGGRLRYVGAELDNRGLVGLPKGLEETAVIAGQHDSGLRSTVRLSYAIRPPTRRLRMWGSDGLITWDGVRGRAFRHDGTGRELETFTWTEPDAMYRAQLDAWLGSLRGRFSSRLVEGSEGAYEVAICEAARRSSARGSREEVT